MGHRVWVRAWIDLTMVEKPPIQKKKKPIFLMVLCALVGIFAICALVFVLSYQTPEGQVRELVAQANAEIEAGNFSQANDLLDEALEIEDASNHSEVPVIRELLDRKKKEAERQRLLAEEQQAQEAERKRELAEEQAQEIERQRELAQKQKEEINSLTTENQRLLDSIAQHREEIKELQHLQAKEEKRVGKKLPVKIGEQPKIAGKPKEAPLNNNKTPPLIHIPSPFVRTVGNIPVFETETDKVADDVVFLKNNGIVEITQSVSLSSSRKDAVLFQDGSQWKIWIEDKKIYKCDIIRKPRRRATSSGEKVYVTDIKGDGAVLLMDDGSVYEVSSYNTYETNYWYSPTYALLIDGTKLISFDDPDDDIIEVSKVR